MVLIVIVLAYIIFDYFYYYDLRLSDKYKEHINEQIQSLTSDEVDINEIIPFDWDAAYVYYGNMEEEDFDEYTNYFLQEVSFEPPLSEPYIYWVFTKDNEVVFSRRPENFIVTSEGMKTGSIDIFSFTPEKAMFAVSHDEYGNIVLVYSGY